MKQTKLLKLVTAAVFAALTCVATMVVNVPIPATKGYVNLGDCIVLLSAFFFGPLYGAAAGGLGSMLADILLGYAYYAPGTLLVKGAMAACAALLFGFLQKHPKLPLALSVICSAVSGELLMVVGYFIYESTVLGYGLAAAGSVLPNLLQAAGGAVFATALYRALYTIPAVRKLTANSRKPYKKKVQ